MPQVRAVASQQLTGVREAAEARAAGTDAMAAHFALLARDIARFEDRPHEAWAPLVTQQAPPGAPIGTPAFDWIGDWPGAPIGTPARDWIGAWTAWTGLLCTFEEW